ncbi:MAG: redoxin domain-containing protein [Ignavibacteriales bacterium]|nr:redoxin domain-containing protein [Ignavibacteriales bacterium]
MALKIGDKAPDFTLFNQDGEPVTLSSFKGKNVVVLFFLLQILVLALQKCVLLEMSLKIMKNLNAQVLGISVDTHFALKMFHEKNNYNFPLLSDFNKKVIKDYDVVLDVFVPGKFDYLNTAKRAAFVVDANQNIKYFEVLANPGNQPDFEAIKKALA